MRMKLTAILVGTVLLVLADPSLGWAKESSRKARQAPSLPFSHDLEATLETAKATGKPVVVSFVAVWCPFCRQMKREAFRDPAVVALAEEFLWVSVDIDRDLSTAQEYGIEGVPLIYLLGPEGRTRVEVLGFVGPSEFHDQLTQFLELLETSPESRPPEPTPPDTDRPRSSLTWKPKGYRSHAICFSNVGYGPLKLYSQSPFQALRLGIRPRTPSTLGKGQYEVTGTTTWVNVWGVDEEVGDPSNEFFLDYEMLQLSAAVAYGITDTLQIEGVFTDRSRFGGEMDGLVQGFHDLFGIDQDGRDLVPKDLFTFELAPSDGRPPVSLDNGDRGSFTRSLEATFQHNVTCGTPKLPAFSYAVTARWEAIDVGDLSGGSDLDVGASAALARRFGKVYLYATLGYAWFGRDNFRGLELSDSQWTGLVVFEWRVKPRQSLLLQYLLTEGVIENFGPFSDESNEITVGYKWELRKSGVLELGLIENIIEFDNSPDFGFHVGFSQRF